MDRKIMNAKLQNVLAEQYFNYGDPFTVCEVDEAGFFGLPFKHDVIPMSDEHPTYMYDFFCFYNNETPYDHNSHLEAGFPQFSNTLQLYDINRSNIIRNQRITRRPFWAANDATAEQEVQEYLDKIALGLISGKYHASRCATCGSGGILINLINSIGELVGGSKNKNGQSIPKVEV